MKHVAALMIMVAVLALAGGTALAVTKQCPSGTMEVSPCKGTAKSSTSSGGAILVGTSGTDYIKTLSGNDWINGPAGGKETSKLKPGPGHSLNDDVQVDWGGCSSSQCLGPGPLPASNDTYSGFGFSNITDYGGSPDTLDPSHVPLDEATFEFSDDALIIYLGNLTSQVQISNYLSSRQFRIERIAFSDTTITSVN